MSTETDNYRKITGLTAPLLQAREIKAFQTAISTAQWKLNYHDFCTALGWPKDLYSEKKFRKLTDLVNALKEFDSETLFKLAEAGRW